MDRTKPSCPNHGVRFVSAIRGSNDRGKLYACSYGDFQSYLFDASLWARVLRGLDELGQIIDKGGDDMTDRAKKEILELGEILSMEKKK